MLSIDKKKIYNYSRKWNVQLVINVIFVFLVLSLNLRNDII